MFLKWSVVLLAIALTRAQNGYHESGPGASGYDYPAKLGFSDDEEFSGGEIPGEPGRDYPVYSEVPETSFSCDNQEYPGYYADPEAQCQAFYICQRGGRSDAFLCPNGTVFNQEYLVCDWWYNFDCSRAESLYSVNEQILRAMEEADARLAEQRNAGYQYDEPLLTPDAAYGAPLQGLINGNGHHANGNGHHANGNGHQANGNGNHANGNGHHANGNGHHANGNGHHANGNGHHANGNGHHANGNGFHGLSNGNGYKNGNGNGHYKNGNDNGHYKNGNGNGNGNGHHQNGNGNGLHGNGNGHYRNGNGNGHATSPVYGVPELFARQEIDEFGLNGNGNGNGHHNGNGNGHHNGNGNGHHNGNGNGNGYHNGKGNGYHNGNGNGHHSGNGNGYHNGNGEGHHSGNGYHNGNGNGHHNGNGYHNGNGNGHHNGNGYHNGNGNGHHNGNGNGHHNGNALTQRNGNGNGFAPKPVYGVPIGNNGNGHDNALVAFKNGLGNNPSLVHSNGNGLSSQYGAPEDAEALEFSAPSAVNGAEPSSEYGAPQNTYLPPSKK